jgi:hypothetical protein
MSDLQEPSRWLDDSATEVELRLDLAWMKSSSATGIDFGAVLGELRDAIVRDDEPLAAASGTSLPRGWMR